MGGGLLSGHTGGGVEVRRQCCGLISALRGAPMCVPSGRLPPGCWGASRGRGACPADAIGYCTGDVPAGRALRFLVHVEKFRGGR